MANYNATLQLQGTVGFADSLQSIQDSFAVTLSTYGGTVNSIQNIGGGLIISLTLPDTKTVAELNTLISDINTDIAGEFTVTGAIGYGQVINL